MMEQFQNYNHEIEKNIQLWLQLATQPIMGVSPDDLHSGKDFRAIFENPMEILKQFSGDIPLGHYGYGCSVDEPVGAEDVRQYRYLTAISLSNLLPSHMRIVGPPGAGKSVFTQRLVSHLALNHDLSIVWFSTKLGDDLEFFDDLKLEYTVISANNVPLTRYTRGRFNPLSRIPVRHDRVNSQDCWKLAETLIELIPLDNLSSDTEKFMEHAAVCLAAILELLKYHYGDQAMLGFVPDLWKILPEGKQTTHPLQCLLYADCVPLEVQYRLEQDLSTLLQPQRVSDAIVGATAQLLLTQIRNLDGVLFANDIPNFSQRLRESERPHVLIIDQSDGINSCMSEGLARLVFPFLYEDLVAQCPHDWQAHNLRPVLMVIDEMNSVYAGDELSDCLEKSRSKGVVCAFGQQSSAGNPDPRLNAAMSNNTRIQVVFSGCDATDPQVQELNAFAGRFSPTLEPHRDEPGFIAQERLPIDAITSLGTFASLVRIKSTTGRDRIMWLYQGNPLIPHRSKIRVLKDELAGAIQACHQAGDTGAIPELCRFYGYTKQLLLYSYGYWSTDELRNYWAMLDLAEIDRAYHLTMQALEKRSQGARNSMMLEQSHSEFTREQNAIRLRTLEERKWRYLETEEARQWELIIEGAKSIESYLWEDFYQNHLQQIQKHRMWFSTDPIKRPKLRWYNALIGVHFPDQVGCHWNAVLLEYKKYAENFGQCNPSAWKNGVEVLVKLRIGQSTDMLMLRSSSIPDKLY